MPALAMGLGWAGYTLMLWGYCLTKGYDVTLRELVNPRHVPTWASIRSSHVPPGQILPSAGGLDAKHQPLSSADIAGLSKGVLGVAEGARDAIARRRGKKA